MLQWDIILVDAQRRLKFCATRLMMTMGRAHRHDHSFKASEKVSDNQNSKIFPGGTFSSMNEFNQVGFCNMCENKTHDQVYMLMFLDKIR